MLYFYIFGGCQEVETRIKWKQIYKLIDTKKESLELNIATVPGYYWQFSADNCFYLLQTTVSISYRQLFLSPTGYY